MIHKYVFELEMSLAVGLQRIVRWLIADLERHKNGAIEHFRVSID